MPRIRLKEKSPIFWDDDDDNDSNFTCCEAHGCTKEGLYKAPKDRSLSEYYYFCEQHVREYNQSWDFYAGMSEVEIMEAIRQSMVGDRPTWKFSSYKAAEEYLRAKSRHFFEDQEFQENQSQNQNSGHFSSFSKEHEAMNILNLTPPLTLDKIKERYRSLVKKHHPDFNQGDKEAEELLKKINAAYTILKEAWQKFDRMGKI